MIFLLFSTSLANTGVQFLNKKLVTRGMTPFEYFYYITLALVPFSAVFFLFYPFQIAISGVAIMLLLASAGVRAVSSLSLSGTHKKISPLTSTVYSTFAILLTYFIDVLIGAAQFKTLHFVAIFIVVVGTLIIALKNMVALKQVKGAVLFRVLSEIAKGYLAYFALKHMSAAMYTFLMALLTTIILLPFTKKVLQTYTKQKLTLSVIAQAMGVFNLVLGSILAKSSATLFMLRIPTTLVLTLLLSYLIKKDVGEKPTLVELVGSIIVIVGLSAFSILQMQ
jgi:drug/metabolite transporter (DMT)-like permease